MMGFYNGREQVYKFTVAQVTTYLSFLFAFARAYDLIKNNGGYGLVERESRYRHYMPTAAWRAL